jgi:hypothetical protein
MSHKIHKYHRKRVMDTYMEDGYNFGLHMLLYAIIIMYQQDFFALFRSIETALHLIHICFI